MTLLPDALEYARNGAQIFPLNADKTPATRNGMKDGSTDPDTITNAWRPDSIIGCRIPPNLVLLDIDPRHGGDTVWNALIEAYGPINIGRQHHSGRNDGGFHAWFQHPGGDLFIRKLTDWAISNGVAHQLPTVNGREKWSCGIDILHHGHRYTILPPSPHPETGQPYQWDTENAPGPMPAFLAELLEPPEPPPSLPARTLTATSDSDSIADWYTATASWADILTGWTLTHGDGETDGSKWRHPAATAPYSASIRHGCLFVYSANTVFEETSPSDVTGYTKFRAMAEMSCGGDLSLAASYARELRGPRNDWQPAPDISFNPNTPATEPAPVGDTWPEPVPIGAATTPAPFPLDAFPAWIADQCEQAATEMQLTPDLAAMLAITTLSTVTAGRIEIVVRGPWTEGTNTYTVTSLPPSAGKSPTLKMMCGPLDRWEETLIDDSSKKIADREIARKVREHDRDKHIKQGDETLALAVSDELLELPELHEPQLLADDVTPEKLAELMGEQEGRIALISAEGGGLFGMMTGRYSDKANLEIYLGAWSRDKIARNRMTGKKVLVRRPHLTIGLCVQPQVLQSLADTPELAGRGLTARFMYSLPAETVGTRDLMRASTYNDNIAAVYDRRILGIASDLDARVPITTVDPVRLNLAPDALHAFLSWQQDREAMRAPGQPLQHMAEWVSKCDSTVIRIAGILHTADLKDDDTPIDAETVGRAITIGDYFTSHAAAAFDLMGIDEVAVGAKTLLDWVRRQTADVVTISDLQRNHRRRFPRIADIVEPVEMLVERGWLRPLHGSNLPLRMLVGSGKASPEFAVAPSAATVTAPQPVDNFSNGGDRVVQGPVPFCTIRTTLNTESGHNTTDGGSQPHRVAESGTNGTNGLEAIKSNNYSISSLKGGAAEKPAIRTILQNVDASPVDNFNPAGASSPSITNEHDDGTIGSTPPADDAYDGFDLF